MITQVCPLCPKELGPQPIDNFGLCRARKDGRNLYCMKCIREKVRASRQALKEFRARRRQVLEPQSKPLFAELPTIRFVRRLSPQERVKEAIAKGAKTQTEIRKAAGLKSDHEVGDALANLLLWTHEIRTEVVNNERVYFINESEPEVSRKPSLPASFSTVKGLMPVMKGRKKIGGWIAA